MEIQRGAFSETHNSRGDPYTDPYVRQQVPHAMPFSMQVISFSILITLFFAMFGINRFIEERHKDYFLMYTHHLVTIALVALSYAYGYLRIGAVVMLLHDASGA